MSKSPANVCGEGLLQVVFLMVDFNGGSVKGTVRLIYPGYFNTYFTASSSYICLPSINELFIEEKMLSV